MIDLKRWNWIWLLPCAVFQLMPSTMMAQMPQPQQVQVQMTRTETDCVASAAEEIIQHSEVFRKTFDETVRQVREQRCLSNEPELIDPKSSAFLLLENVLPQAAQPKLAACFAANPARMQHVNGSVNFVLSNKLKQSLPEPFCP